MAIQRVMVIGGSGFIGTAVVSALAREGVAVLVPTRDPRHCAALAVLPRVEVVVAEVHRKEALVPLLAGVDAVVNLVGVLHSRSGSPWGPGFERAHVALPHTVVAACAEAGVHRLVHISALGANPEGPSEYQRSKAAGEAAIRAAGPELEWTLLRPSVVFGPHDHFLNMFAALARIFPVLPLAGANARFQPVYVGDVARCVVHCLLQHAGIGQILELAGPRIYTLRELVRYAAARVGRRPWIFALPEPLAMLQAALMERAPTPLMSRDTMRSMRVDNVARGPAQPFGFMPTSLEAVAPLYLGGGPRRLYYVMRQRARRA